MTRAARCYEMLCQRGVAYLADEIGWVGAPDDPPDEMSLIRPDRALEPHEALNMIRAWAIAYEGTPDAFEYEDEIANAHLMHNLCRPSPRHLHVGDGRLWPMPAWCSLSEAATRAAR